MGVEKPPARWTRISTRCNTDHCVVVSAYNDHVEMRDSKSPGEAPLSFTVTAWRTFLEEVRSGRFDPPR